MAAFEVLFTISLLRFAQGEPGEGIAGAPGKLGPPGSPGPRGPAGPFIDTTGKEIITIKGEKVRNKRDSNAHMY